MITDKIGRHEVLLPINHNPYNFPKKEKTNTFRTNISGRDHVQSKNIIHFENSLVFILF